MRIGVPKEIKNNEFRVGLTPASVYELAQHGHKVFIETLAGVGSGYADQDYIEAGGSILDNPSAIFEQSQLIVKVKEPQAEERQQLNTEHILFTYLHLAPDPTQTDDLLTSGATCIAYEMVTDQNNQLPLLTPMSEVAGRMSVLAGAHCLEKSQGGRGVLFSGVAGVEPANVVIIGAGIVGSNAATIAIGMGANVTILDKSINALRRLESQFGNRIKTISSTKHALLEQLKSADLVIGAVLIPGASAPKLVLKKDLKIMKQGAVIVDVAVDQGGCFESTRPTTHENPTFTEEGVVHYCVANMPGAFARTATQALNNATLPYILEIAEKGCKRAFMDNKGLLHGLSIINGTLCCEAVGTAQKKAFITIKEAYHLLS
jgi:alanine dehydrogenase